MRSNDYFTSFEWFKRLLVDINTQTWPPAFSCCNTSLDYFARILFFYFVSSKETVTFAAQ